MKSHTYTLYKKIESLSLSLNLDGNIVRVDVREASLASEHCDKEASILGPLHNTTLEGPNLKYFDVFMYVSLYITSGFAPSL